MNRFTTCIGIIAFGLAACSEDPQAPGGAARPDSLTVDATASWAYVNLFEGTSRAVSVTDAANSAAWHIAFFATSVMVNGGAAGPGGVLGYCVCQNGGLSDLQVSALRASDGLTAFEAVGASAIPAADSLWRSDALAPAIAGWWRYNSATRQVSAVPDTSYLVRASDGQAFAKFHVVQLANATQTTAGRVTFEYALQASKGAAMGAVQSVTLDVPATSRVFFDLNTGTLTQTGWDLAFQGYDIRVNGGVSGSGSAGAVASGTPFASIADASAPPASVYRADAFGGVFEGRKWYRYNVTGTDNQIWPTYDVYLIKRGSTVFKVQLINYYNGSGTARFITFRYAKLTN
jgi:heme-binding HmuY-like protein